MFGHQLELEEVAGQVAATPASLNRTQPLGLPISRSASSLRAPSAAAADQPLVIAGGAWLAVGPVGLGRAGQAQQRCAGPARRATGEARSHEDRASASRRGRRRLSSVRKGAIANRLLVTTRAMAAAHKCRDRRRWLTVREQHRDGAAEHGQPGVEVGLDQSDQSRASVVNVRRDLERIGRPGRAAPSGSAASVATAARAGRRCWTLISTSTPSTPQNRASGIVKPHVPREPERLVGVQEPGRRRRPRPSPPPAPPAAATASGGRPPG